MKNLFFFFAFLAVLPASAQTATEIYLFDLENRNGRISISNGRNISRHKGYDNQPFFHPGQPLIYYASFDDSSRSDIRVYNYQSGETKNLTSTREREYSPTVTPDRRFLSCILQRDNGAQDLVKYPIEGGAPQLLVFHLKVGYHAWAGENKLMLFVLDDSTRNSLHYYYLDKNTDTVVAENIGRSLHRIPGQEAMSFVQKITDQLSVVKRYDMTTGVLSNIIYTLPGQDQLAWLNDGTILMSDGKQIYFHRVSPSGELKDKRWTPVIVDGDVSMLKGVTRLAVDIENKRIAVVVAE